MDDRFTSLSEQETIRREKLKDLQAEGFDPFLITRFDQGSHSTDIVARYDALAEQTVSVAGRMMSRRVMGKASFLNLLDRDGMIQAYVRREDIGEEAYVRFKQMDIGDILGVSGKVFKTKTGEVSIHAERVTLLSKSLKVLPEKFHGLKDPDLRYRQRPVDLIVNPEVRETFIKRSRIISEMRRYFDGLGFLEVETPVLNTVASGGHARPFLTHHNALDFDMYLRIALELRLKQLIVGGLERVYEISRCFRNEGMDAMHNPEFTMMELYQAYTNMDGMMEIAEGVIAHCAKAVLGTTKVTYQGHEIELMPPFRRMSMNGAVRQYTGADFLACESEEEAHALAKTMHLPMENKRMSKGQVLAAAFDAFVEDKLIQPVFITDYPIEISPLAKKKPGCPGITERFELFIAGHEYANAFSELNDPVDQRERFMQQAMERANGDEEAMVIDEEFCESLEYGMPPTGGIGIGVDRLVMLLTDSATIRDVLLFPTMKPKN
ncbi:MAG: lysine--tRNA ligase [Firmicutes bacterium]|nr:lysine--tRNA ligase [Bacillota bacterium]